jgi:hypothetical protein
MTRALKITGIFTAAVIASGIAVFCWPIAACLYRRGN